METPPPICAFIRETRERLKEEAKAEGGLDAAHEFSQEAVARRVGPKGLSLKAYRAYEKDREPGFARRREIAVALGLKEDYFEGDGSLSALRNRLEDGLDRLEELLERFEGLGTPKPRKRD
jgi:transcriptional regulator with XRE-family HTH domain